MSARAYHYAVAEALLAEGVEVVQKIARVPLDEIDGTYPPEDRYAAIQRRRDDLGKKAMGIWAQAQVHATLALATEQIELTADDYSPTITA